MVAVPEPSRWRSNSVEDMFHLGRFVTTFFASGWKGIFQCLVEYVSQASGPYMNLQMPMSIMVAVARDELIVTF